jgi:hypothetical protein
MVLRPSVPAVHDDDAPLEPWLANATRAGRVLLASAGIST